MDEVILLLVILFIVLIFVYICVSFINRYYNEKMAEEIAEMTKRIQSEPILLVYNDKSTLYYPEPGEGIDEIIEKSKKFFEEDA